MTAVAKEFQRSAVRHVRWHQELAGLVFPHAWRYRGLANCWVGARLTYAKDILLTKLGQL